MVIILEDKQKIILELKMHLTFLVLFGTRGFGFKFSLFSVACLTILLISTAYIAEIIRAGFESIHPNQWEAAAVTVLTDSVAQ